MLRRNLPIFIALAALLAANAWLWWSRPSALPVTPRVESSEPQTQAGQPSPEPQQAAETRAEPSPEPQQAAETRAEPAPEPAPADRGEASDKPLALTLTPDLGGLEEDSSASNAITGPLVLSPRFDLTPESRGPVRPWIKEDLDLFNVERGTRAFTRGQWISDRVRLRGGIGYSEDENTQEPDIAVGVGFDIAF